MAQYFSMALGSVLEDCDWYAVYASEDGCHVATPGFSLFLTVAGPPTNLT